MFGMPRVGSQWKTAKVTRVTDDGMITLTHKDGASEEIDYITFAGRYLGSRIQDQGEKA